MPSKIRNRLIKVALNSHVSIGLIYKYMHQFVDNDNEISTSVRANILPWLRHQMETFSALLALCVGNSPVTGYFHA